jgi:predicted metal-dependent hydrolase
MNCSHYWRRQIVSKVSKLLNRKQAFKRRVHEWAAKLEVNIVWLGVRPMHNKWASCSNNGHLNFNAELLSLDQQLWDYVIVHELLHFFVPNHGKLWKSLMRAHLGDYESSAAKLREERHHSE